MDRPQGLKRKRDDGEDTIADVNWDEVNGGFMDDESEPHKFGTTVLPVANLPDSFDGVPQNGLEYLFTVRREERRLPLVTKVPNPYASPENTMLQSLKDQQDGRNLSIDVIPSEEWRLCFEQRFKNFRTNMQQPTIYVPLPNPSSSNCSKIPEMRDRDRWWGYFRGDRSWESIPSSLFHGKKAGKAEKRKRETVGYEEALPQHGEKTRGWVVYEENLSWDQAEEGGVATLSYDDGKNATAIDVDEGGEGEDGEVLNEEPALDQDQATAAEVTAPILSDNLPMAVKAPPSLLDDYPPREPTPHVLSLLDQKTTFHLLKYFSQWIQGHFDRSFLPAPPPRPGSHPGSHGHTKPSYDLTPSHARWMFALLSRLDAQLTSDEISVLRKLAREVLRLIKEERSSQGVLSKNSSPLLPNIGETACWMIIAAVAGVWGQKDLWVDAVDILR